MIEDKKHKLKSFRDVDEFWIGAKFDLDRDLWQWSYHHQLFKTYTNWVGGITGKIKPDFKPDIFLEVIDTLAGSGCGLQCLATSKLTMVASRDYNWVATNTFNETRPYICQSTCPRTYKWYPRVKKCLKIMPSAQDGPDAL